MNKSVSAAGAAMLATSLLITPVAYAKKRIIHFAVVNHSKCTFDLVNKQVTGGGMKQWGPPSQLIQNAVSDFPIQFKGSKNTHAYSTYAVTCPGFDQKGVLRINATELREFIDWSEYKDRYALLVERSYGDGFAMTSEGPVLADDVDTGKYVTLTLDDE